MVGPPVPAVLLPSQPYPVKPIELLDELLASVLLLLSLVFLLLLELTRRRVLSLHQFTFFLASGFSTLTLGGFIEHNVHNEFLEFAMHGYYNQPSTIIQLRYVPLGIILATSIGFVVYCSICSCECCCRVITTKDTSHQACYIDRLRHAASIYSIVSFFLFIVLGMRLNARMRLSAIKPIGGTLHWTILQVPLLLAVIHIGSILHVLLYQLLQHVNVPCQTPQSLLMNDPQPTQIQPAPNRSRSVSRDFTTSQTTTHKSALAQSIRSMTPPSEPSPRATSIQRQKTLSSDEEVTRQKSLDIDSHTRRATGVVQRVSPVRQPTSSTETTTSQRKRATPIAALQIDTQWEQPRRRRATPVTKVQTKGLPNDDGDKSQLISSESETDEDVIVPSSIRQFTSDFAVKNLLGTKPLGNEHHPWTLCYDETTGASYYYNQETGASTWENPHGHTKWE